MYLGQVDDKPMPIATARGAPARMDGRFVFFRADMQTAVVVVQIYGGPNGRVFGVVKY
jgi:hypothetical protein